MGTGEDQQQMLTIKNNKIKYLEKMLSLAEDNRRNYTKL
jgi:hypothetical protein